MIETDDIPQLVTKYFDELMVLFHIVGNREDIRVSTDSSMPVSFKLFMDSESDAVRLYNAMNELNFSVFDEMYVVQMNRSEAILHTNILKASSL